MEKLESIKKWRDVCFCFPFFFLCEGEVINSLGHESRILAIGGILFYANGINAFFFVRLCESWESLCW